MTLYEQLDVPSDADAAEIKAAYRQKAQKHHPDKGGDTDQFQAIQHAYDVLSDADRRARYDECGAESNELTLREKAIIAMQNLLVQVVDQIDIKHTDIVATTIKAVNRHLDSLRDQKAELDKKVERRLEAIKRLSHAKGKDNPLTEALEADIASKRQTQSAINDEIEVVEEAVRMLREYKYQCDAVAEDDDSISEIWRMFGTLGSWK